MGMGTDVFSSILGYMGTQDTNQANKEIAQENNAWSAQQFATRYQTSVNDMQKAGLNPMLAYSQGGGSPPTAQQVQFQNPVASALEGYHRSVERDQMRQQIDLSKAQANNVNADTAVKNAQASLIAEQTKQSSATTVAQEQIARDAEGRANLSAVDLVRRGQTQSTQIQTQEALAKTYIDQLKVNKANIGNLVSMSFRNTQEGRLARAKIAEAVARGDISSADVARARNEERYQKSPLGASSPYRKDIGTQIKDIKSIVK